MDCQLHGTEHSSRHIDDCSVSFYFASTCSWNFVSLFLNGWLEHLELWSVHVSLLLWDFSARWFVPWLCLPHVYNYRRFLQAKGHRGTSGKHFQSERQDTDGYKIHQENQDTQIEILQEVSTNLTKSRKFGCNKLSFQCDKVMCRRLLSAQNASFVCSKSLQRHVLASDGCRGSEVEPLFEYFLGLPELSSLISIAFVVVKP